MQQSLATELATEAAKAQSLAIRNYRFAFWCLLLALVLNALAVAFVASDLGTKTLRAGAAALPGLLILANQVFKFDLRSRWWWLKHHKVESLARALLYEHLPDAQVSQAFSQIQLESERDYPTFDISPLRPDGKVARTP